MPLHVLGINHHSAPLEVREKLAFPQERQGDALADLAAQPGVAEAVLVSTCNRTEVYCRADDPARVRAWLVGEAAKSGLNLDNYLYQHNEDEAVRHAFRVACGLDSMVIGEPQILGQVKQSVRTAEGAGTLGSLLNRLFQQTFSVAKQVRSETALGAQSVSMAATALKLAQNVYGDLSRTKLLLVGVGEMVELAATYFVAQQPSAVVVANRTLARGEEFAERFGAAAIPLTDLATRLPEFDIVVTGTAAPTAVIDRAMVERALKTRKHRPIFIVDFAVPRDVDAEVARMQDIFLYTVDELGSIVQEGVESRRAAMQEAEMIVKRQVEAFRAWQASRGAVSSIVALRRKADAYREAELAKAKARIARGEDAAVVLEALARGLANKFLHHPTRALSSARDEERASLERAIEKLYPMDEGEGSGDS